MIHSQVMMLCLSSVPITASNMPTSASYMPRRAVAGELSPFRPRMKSTEAAR